MTILAGEIQDMNRIYSMLFIGIIISCSSPADKVEQNELKNETPASEIVQVESTETQVDTTEENAQLEDVDPEGDVSNQKPKKEVKDSTDPRVQRILDEKLIKEVKDSIKKHNSEK